MLTDALTRLSAAAHSGRGRGVRLCERTVSAAAAHRSTRCGSTRRGSRRIRKTGGVETVSLDDRGTGPPLVLLHGLATTRVIWRHVLPLLSEARRVIALDVPGFGDAPPAGDGFELDVVADAIAGSLPARFDLVGHSMGGAVALTLAARHAERVRRLVLVAPAGLRAFPPIVGAVAGALSDPLNALPLADLAWGRRVLLGVGTLDAAALAPSEVRMLVGASRGATRVGEALATVATTDLRPLLRALPLPVGAVWGDHDHVVPSAGVDVFRECRPEAPVEVVEDAGHIPMIERPQAFADALTRVLAVHDS
jgi:pimeloyl-[acyl-carrier protein] methyl ester esterase